MESSAFPTPQASSLGLVARAIEIPERSTHIPAFYVQRPHQNPESITVTKDGVPLLGTDGRPFTDGVPLLGTDGRPFTVSQVAPERRYAIGHDGEVIPVNDFSEIHKQVHLEFYSLAREKNPDVKFTGDINLIPIPNPEHWVKWRIDPENDQKLLEIGFDPHATAGAKPDHFVDSEGEDVEGDRLEHLCAAYASPKLRAALTTSERAEVEEHLGIEEAVDITSGVAGKLEQLTELHEEGSLSTEKYLEKVRALTGVAPSPTPPPEPPPPPVTFESKCGKPCKSLAGKLAHERRCEVCGEIGRPTEEDTT
jgi:hypothetical protein